jgi:crossover junction endodeoxyribonuclease RuvC
VDNENEPRERTGAHRMIILGVDPGSLVTGYGLVQREGARTIYIRSGTIRNSAEAQAKRLFQVHTELDAVIRECRPSAMAVESLFHASNTQSLIKLSQVRGVILLLAEMHGLDLFEYAPLEIKQGLTGFGRADKKQVLFMVSKILNLPELKSKDEADALAMALYHAHICKSQGMINDCISAR